MQLLGDAVRDRLGDRAGGGRGRARGSGGSPRAAPPCAAGHSASKSRRFLAAAPRRRWIAWSSSPAALTCPCSPCEQPHQQALGEVRVLQLVDEQVAIARRDPRAHVRLRAQHAEGIEQQVAEVERPRLLEHAVVGRVDGGELALAVGLGAERPRPRRVVLVRDQLVLEAVDAADDRAQQGARVAADVVRGERQLVDALEQHRDAVGGRDGRGERVEPRLERLVVQQPRAEVVHGRDGQLLEAAVEAGLEPLAQLGGARLGDGEDEDRLRRQAALADQPGEALAEHGRLARARTADHEQRAAGMRDGLELAGGRRHHRRIGPVAASDPARDTDWLRICRRATSALRGILAEQPTTAERVREVGTRGEGGDRTLLIDAAAEEAVFQGARGAARRGAALHGRQRGARHDRLRRHGHARRGRPDRRLGQREARPAAPFDLDRGRRRRHDGRRLLRLRPRLRPGRGVGRPPRPGRLARRPPPAQGGRASAARPTASSSCSASSPPIRAGSATRRMRSSSAPTGCGRSARSPRRSARWRRRGSTAWSRSGAAARSTPPPAQLIVREAGGLVAFPRCATPLGAPLDLIPHSPLVAARTERALEQLAEIPVV